MKLAEALQERADLNRRIQQLRSRLVDNAVIQEGVSPAEDTKELLAELDRCIEQFEELVAHINLTNCQTTLDGKTLTQHIARRDALTLKLSAYRDVTQSGRQLGHRVMHSEIRLLSTVDVRGLQKQIDAISKELRLLDNSIQAANWATELM